MEKQTVFRKVKVSNIHVGKWMFYLTPTGFKGYGIIENPSVIQGLYRCNDTYASNVLEEIEFPSDDELNKLKSIGDDSEVNIYDTGFYDGVNYILNKLR